MSELAVRTDTVGAFDPRNEQIVKYLGLNPADPKSVAVVAVARRYDLDPLLKHVVLIVSKKHGTATVYITRDGLLHVAHQSGQLDGIVVEQEPVLSDDGGEWVARVSVWRKDMGHPFTFPGRFSATADHDYAQEMALKAAESHALRRAFDVAGLPSLDERRAERAPERHGTAPVTAADIVGEPQSQTVEWSDSDTLPDPVIVEEPSGQSALGRALNSPDEP